MIQEKYYNTEIEDWCELIDCCSESRFLERVKSTGILTHPYRFNIYLKRRMPDKSLKHVHTWKNTLPDPEDIGITFGGGEAVIDFEVLPEDIAAIRSVESGLLCGSMNRMMKRKGKANIKLCFRIKKC